MGPAVDAWKRGSKQWKAWSPRAISTCLQMTEGERGRLHIVSCSAPTRATKREEKENVFQEFESMLLSVPTGERYILLLGNFNACTGSRCAKGDQWGDERGPHGYGVVNDAGAELLSFLSLHQVAICNTWFKKKDIHKYINLAASQVKTMELYRLKAQQDRRMCLDVSVKRGVECNTDHLGCFVLKSG